MSSWVIDTSVLVDHLRGRPEATRLLEVALDGEIELWSSSVVRTEIWAGARAKEERSIRLLLAQLHWREVDNEIADEAGRLARQYLRSHPGIDTADYLIAATTIVLASELKTQNTKHFPMFDELPRAYSV